MRHEPLRKQSTAPVLGMPILMLCLGPNALECSRQHCALRKHASTYQTVATFPFIHHLPLLPTNPRDGLTKPSGKQMQATLVYHLLCRCCCCRLQLAAVQTLSWWITKCKLPLLLNNAQPMLSPLAKNTHETRCTLPERCFRWVIFRGRLRKTVEEELPSRDVVALLNTSVAICSESICFQALINLKSFAVRARKCCIKIVQGCLTFIWRY